MKTVFVKAVFDINCKIFNHARKNNIMPVYRVFVNDELFTERTWIWEDVYLEEILQIQAAAGQYQVQLQAVMPEYHKFTVSNHRIEHGPAQWIGPIVGPGCWLNNHYLEILP
jgi:hypothetical protein